MRQHICQISQIFRKKNIAKKAPSVNIDVLIQQRPPVILLFIVSVLLVFIPNINIPYTDRLHQVFSKKQTKCKVRNCAKKHARLQRKNACKCRCSYEADTKVYEKKNCKAHENAFGILLYNAAPVLFSQKAIYTVTLYNAVLRYQSLTTVPVFADSKAAMMTRITTRICS